MKARTVETKALWRGDTSVRVKSERVEAHLTR